MEIIQQQQLVQQQRQQLVQQQRQQHNQHKYQGQAQAQDKEGMVINKLRYIKKR
jgi:hypothetical protein